MSGDWAMAIRAVIGADVPVGVVVVHVDEGGDAAGGGRAGAHCDRGRTVAIDVVVDSTADAALSLSIAGSEVRVPPKGAAVETIDLDGAHPVFTVALDGEVVTVDERGANLHDGRAHPRVVPLRTLVGHRCERRGWFPDGVLAKWDFHHRPFFHGHDVTLTVPAEALEVVCTRGLEFDRSREVAPAAGRRITVECEPARRDRSCRGRMVRGDLHVHMNYSGDLVCTPGDAGRMQLGEGLHLVNLVAANCLTSRVYDREMLGQFAGNDLPWSTGACSGTHGCGVPQRPAGPCPRAGPSGPPSRYFTGHDRSDHPEDWPPNKVGCDELRGLGATVGVLPSRVRQVPRRRVDPAFFRNPRSVEARELVADAALGVVDSIDIISPADHEGAVFLYHRLLSCGLRLAATAGTDTFLSFSHSRTSPIPPGGVGSMPISVTGVCRWRRSRTRSAPAVRWSPTGRGSPSR